MIDAPVSERDASSTLARPRMKPDPLKIVALPLSSLCRQRVLSFTVQLRRGFWRLRQLARWDQSYRSAAQRRITVISQFFPPDFAATGQLLDDLTERLAARGNQIQILTGMPAYAFNQSTAEPVEFQPRRVIFRSRASSFFPRRIRGRALNGLLFCLRTTLRLLKYSRRGDKLVYTTEPPYLPVFGSFIYSLTRTPYTLILYDLYPDVLVELGILSERNFFTRFWRQLNRSAYQNATDVVVLSEPMRRRVVFFTPSVADRIHVIPSWADTDSIRPISKTDNWFVQRYGLKDTFNVLYSGNQGRCHDLVTLMAAALLLRKNPRFRFIFIGCGPQNSRIRSLAADWGLTNCLFLPYQDFEVLPWSLSSADLAVISLGIATVGLVAPSKLYGHLAAGTPLAIISPPESDLKDFVQAGKGAWFSNGDGDGLARWIESVASNHDELTQMRLSCRHAALESFSSEVAADAYARILS